MKSQKMIEENKMVGYFQSGLQFEGELYKKTV